MSFPKPQRQAWLRESKDSRELEEQLLRDVNEAERAFHSASPAARSAATERYRMALEKFNSLILGNRFPPASSSEP